MGDPDLQRRLEKLGAQLVSDIERWEQRTRDERHRVLDDLTHTLEAKLSGALKTLEQKQHEVSERQQRKRAREDEALRRKLERRRRRAPTLAKGVVFLVAALLCAAFAFLRPDLWWMVFVALGLGLVGTGQLTGARRAAKELPAVDTRHEVDALCDHLLADLAASPQAVRQFISDPEKTVATMRTTLKALDQRRQQLLVEDAPGRLAKARSQREQLSSRRDATLDPEARGRLDDALTAMDGQLSALQQLATITERVDGEYTALLVHLQELRTRVSVAKSSGTHVQLEGVKGSVLRLNEELAAISEAMTAVQRGDLQQVLAMEPPAQATVTPERLRS
ncbi:MAG: hypothetical protein Q8L48_19840 [Archangium sp.]|nr:hypothetical protein [Archangium sp.]